MINELIYLYSIFNAEGL